jgi:hypothetical protein
MARAASKYMSVAEQKMAEDKSVNYSKIYIYFSIKLITQLEAENHILRSMLNDIPIYQSATTSTTCIGNNDHKTIITSKESKQEMITSIKEQEINTKEQEMSTLTKESIKE